MIKIENLSDNITVPYSLALLKGVLSPIYNYKNTEIRVTNSNNSCIPDGITWPVIQGRFVAYVQLSVGINIVSLSCEKTASRKIRIIHKPPPLDRFVRLVYIVCKGDRNPEIQSPPNIDNSLKSICSRISLAAQMLQLFVAESLHAHGLGRKTFLTESDNCYQPVCHVFKTSLTRSEAQSKTDKELWSYIGCELMTSNFTDKEKCKFLAFVSFTEYNNPDKLIPKNHQDVLTLTKGHAALGGGGLALLGTGCMYTWPCSLNEIISCFTNTTLVDKTCYMDDSCGRGSYWACYSTTLGAACHELGHVFDLAHDPDGIMARGFDDMVCFFTIPELLEPFRKNSAWRSSQKISTSSCSQQIISSSASNSQNKLLKDIKMKYNQSLNDTGNLCLVPSIEVQSCVTDDRMSRMQTTDFKLPAPLNSNGQFGGAMWHRSSAVILAFHKWFNIVTEEKNMVELDKLKILSNNAIRILQIRNHKGFVVYYEEFLAPPEIHQFDLSDMLSQNALSGDSIIFIEDKHGNVSKINLKMNEISELYTKI